MNLGSLIVKLLLERSQFRAELAQTVQETNAAASDIKGQAQALAGAVSDAMGAQTTAVQTTVRALGVLGPVLGTVAAAAAVVGVAHHQAAQETLAYEKAIILSGNAAGVTSGQLADMARRIDSVAGTQANAAAALATMTASGKVAAENLEKVSLAAIEMERATGQAVGDTERIFARLGDAPTKAALSLNESMHFLTASTYAQIKAAEDLGDKEGAAAIAQGAAADAMRTRAAEIEQHLGSLERVMRGVRSVAAEMWDAVLDIGRPATLDSQIAALNNKIKQTAWRGPAATEGLQQEIAYLQEQQRMVKRSTEAQAENNRVQQARIELSQALEQTASKQEKMALAVARANALADRSGATAAQRLQLVTAAQEKFSEKSTSATKATASEYDKLMQRLGVDVPKAAAQAQAAQQGYNKAQAEFVALAGSPAWAEFTNEQRASAAAMFEQKIASEQAAEAARSAAEEKAKAQELLAKADLEAAQAREKYIASLATGLDKIQAEIAAQEEATARMGLSKEAIADLDAAKLEMMATDLELQAIKAMDRNLDEQTYDALKQQAQAYRDLAKAKQAGAAKEVAVDEAKKAADEWQRTSDQVNQSLTDALMRGFESGKDFAQNLRDTVVNMFKTMVLRPVISAIISPISGALLGGLGLAGTASAGQSALSTVGSIGSGYSLLSGLGGAFGGGLAGGFGGLMGSLGLSATGSTLGGAMSAGSIALGSGNILGGLGTIAGALGPIALGIGLLSSLIKKSTPHMGAGVTYSAADGLVRGADQYSQANYGFGAAGEYNSAAESTVGAVARGIATALDSTARTFGRQAGFEISTAFADDKSKDGAWGQLAIRRNGETILDWRDTQTSRWAPREFSDGEAGLQEYQTAVAQSMREALDKMDLPGWAGDMLDALGDSPSIENLGATLDQINAAQVALEQMGKNLVGFADYTSAAIDALVKAAGGVDSLVSAASTYYDNFYTDAEKAANVTRDVTAALADVGLQMPTTREGFRALVEQQMALGEAGAEAVAALLGVSGAFASVTQAADAAAQAAEQARESAISAAFSGLQRAVKREQEWLQARIDVASEARDALSGLFDLLHDNVQDLYGSVGSAAVQQGAQASAYIAQALATARGTGYLPETDALSDAISAARGGMDATQYATQFEADRDRLVLAGQLAELEGMAGEQLTTAERTLKELQQQNDQLEQTLEYWRDQIELSQAGVDATLSVADAIARLQDAMFPGDKPGSGSGSGSAGGAAGFGPGGITWGGQGPEAKYKTPISLATAGVGYQPVTDPEQIARLDSLSSTYHKYDGTGDLVGLLTAMREAGATTADLSALSGYFESDWRRAAESVGIPAFDVGTNRVPRDMLAVVHKDEAIIPAAYNPWAGGGAAAGGNAELVAEVRALRAELAQLRASSAATASNTAQMADQFDNVSGGGNAVRMEAVA